MSCKFCGKDDCDGGCDNYVLEIIDNYYNTNSNELEQLFAKIPFFHFALNTKINSIFGTDLEVAENGEVNEGVTKEFNDVLYKTNENGIVNLTEIKTALKQKEIYGTAYIFFDDVNKNFYFVDYTKVKAHKIDENLNPIIDSIQYYTVGETTPPENGVLKFKANQGYIYDDVEGGYFIKPSNMIKLQADSYVLNSDLLRLQVLIDIYQKVHETTVGRDYGDVFLFSDKARQKKTSATTNPRTLDKLKEMSKQMWEDLADQLKQNRVKDSHVVALDPEFEKVEQVRPLNTVADYSEYVNQTEDIIASIFSFPRVLIFPNQSSNVGVGNELKNARANSLTPLKSDVANALSPVVNALFDKEDSKVFYLRFKDYDLEDEIN